MSSTFTRAHLRKRPDPQAIVAGVCAYYTIELGDLLGRSRHPDLVLARELAVCAMRNYTLLSWPQIARVMGRPGHSTCITAYERCRNRGHEWAALVESIAGLAGGAG